MAHPSESSHWYKKRVDGSGESVYTVIGANGKERPTTLRDARKLFLKPSVTSVMGLAYKPGLELWKQRQNIMAALTIPRIEGETDDALIERIITDSKEQARKAAERGTQIHAWVQSGFEGEVQGDAKEYYQSVRATLDKSCGVMEWVPEACFCTEAYGGKVDLHNEVYIVDIKTTDKPLLGIKTWDEHAQQLAAYRMGLGFNPPQKCGIVYVQADTKESIFLPIGEEALQRGLNCFMALLNYWYANTGLGGTS